MHLRNDNGTWRGRPCIVYSRFFVKTPSPNTSRKLESTVP
jgi:hypothetical protein